MATYAACKKIAINILDQATREADLDKDYGGKYTAKSYIFFDLGIPPERMQVMPIDVNTELKKLGAKGRVTSEQLRRQKTIGDFITLFCKFAKVTVPAGEPK